MKKTLICLIFFAPFLAAAQHLDLSGDWTTGREIYSSDKINDTLWSFHGGNLHEGGSNFAIRMDKNDSLSIAGRYPHDDSDPSIGRPGYKIDYIVIDSVRILVVREPGGGINNLLRAMKPEETLGDIVVNSMTNYDLAGKYINTANGRPVVFYPGKRVAEGTVLNGGYEFEEEYDEPVDVIRFDKGGVYCYRKTDTGLLVYKAKKIDDDGWDKGILIMRLKKTGWFNLSGREDLPGPYSFASTVVLTTDILDCFTTNQLRWIRNEIFARHGLIFTTDEMKKYFAVQSWYTPQFINVDDKLTELERLNIRLLKKYEEEKRQWELQSR